MTQLTKGNVFSIEEFSIYDGPGIRTSVFLKGCPLRCSWCHNPEGQSKNTEIVKSPNGCISCGNCQKYAITTNHDLIYTDLSIKSCPMNLLRYCGDSYDVNELCDRILKNKDILLVSGGGVTFSGGEPTLQHEFLISCLEYLSGKIHRAVQTCGYCDLEIFSEVVSLSDYILFDIKLINSELHKKFTGVDNNKILNNFEYLVKINKPFVVRIPLIPTVTDTEANIDDIAKLLCSYGITYAELLPYNKMAGGKYEMLGRKYTPMFDESYESIPRKEIFEKYGIKVKIF